MPTVYRSPKATRACFHRSPDCHHLARKVPGKAQPQIEAIELADLGIGIPCRRCYPDSPKVRSAHVFCPQCNIGKAQPCPHNGGVQVMITRTRRKPKYTAEVGDSFTQTAWVWPERAHLFSN